MQDRHYAKKDNHNQGKGTGKMENCTCVSASKDEANKILNYLLKTDLVRKDLKIRYDGNSVLIPVKQNSGKPGLIFTEGIFEPRTVQISPIERARMHGKGKNIEFSFPEKTIRLGKALIIKESRFTGASREALAIIAGEFGAESIYVDLGIGNTVERKPDVKLVYGPGGDTMHIENGVKYKLDPEKVMFSPGNVNARGARVPLDLTGKTVLDMFAGIGYFTLPLALNHPNSRIYPCELNPTSVDYLRRNISANHLESTIMVLPGDCRTTTSGIHADYIIMGHFQCDEFLNTALLRSKVGTLIDMHILARTDEIETKWLEINEKAAHFGYGLDLVSQKKVKSYSVHLWHISVLLRVNRTNKG